MFNFSRLSFIYSLEYNKAVDWRGVERVHAWIPDSSHVTFVISIFPAPCAIDNFSGLLSDIRAWLSAVRSSYLFGGNTYSLDFALLPSPSPLCISLSL
jgi:hypothetical protein